jgi:hypothetical protein
MLSVWMSTNKSGWWPSHPHPHRSMLCDRRELYICTVYILYTLGMKNDCNGSYSQYAAGKDGEYVVLSVWNELFDRESVVLYKYRWRPVGKYYFV